MTDRRAFFKVDVAYLRNPKIAPLIARHPKAVLFHLACIAYSAENLTDGIVPLKLIQGEVGCTNRDIELVQRSGLISEMPDGMRLAVHDYLEHQRSAESVKSLSQAQRANANRRWHANSTANGNASGITPMGVVADAKGNAEREIYPPNPPTGGNRRRRRDPRQDSADPWDTYPEVPPEDPPEDPR